MRTEWGRKEKQRKNSERLVTVRDRDEKRIVDKFFWIKQKVCGVG